MENGSQIINKSNFWSNLFKPPSEKSDLETVLLSMPPFRDLSSKYLKLLLKLFHDRFYSANEYVFYQGDPGIGLYIIREGEISVTQTYEDNREYELARFGRSDFFGELALLDHETRSASSKALKDSNLAVIFKPDLDEFVEKYPKIGIKILRGISEIVATRLRNVNCDFLSLYYKSIENSEEIKK
ncbi:cyclic nucleotide-binding domain-containing protein [Bacteroidota bacterium]